MGKLKDNWFKFVDNMNKKGIPVPTVRDPKTGQGSITAALVVFAAGLFGFCILFLLATAVSKWAGIFTLTDVTISQVRMAADYSFQFLLAALGGYLGRHMQKEPSTRDATVSTDQPADPTSKSSQKVDSPD